MAAHPAWDSRIFRRAPEVGERTFPILHAGNFALPNQRGDFGSGAVDVMRGHHVLVVLLEQDPEAVHTALFRRRGFPIPRADDFSPRALQRTLPGQSGVQYFFSHRNRAFCLYLVIGDHGRRRRLVTAASAFLSRVEVQ